jgi:hypothetical protein
MLTLLDDNTGVSDDGTVKDSDAAERDANPPNL